MIVPEGEITRRGVVRWLDYQRFGGGGRKKPRTCPENLVREIFVPGAELRELADLAARESS